MVQDRLKIMEKYVHKREHLLFLEKEPDPAVILQSLLNTENAHDYVLVLSFLKRFEEHQLKQALALIFLDSHLTELEFIKSLRAIQLLKSSQQIGKEMLYIIEGKETSLKELLFSMKNLLVNQQGSKINQYAMQIKNIAMSKQDQLNQVRRANSSKKLEKFFRNERF
jgi:hypothetical protein